MKRTFYGCSCGDIQTSDPNDAHFDMEGHTKAEGVDVRDVDWNAFEQAPADLVQSELQLPDICGATTAVFGQTVTCRLTHRPQTNGPHKCMVNNESGDLIEVTWM